MSHTDRAIAIAHEHYLERGGGEHVADELARTFTAEQDVYAGLVREEATADDITPTALCDGLLGRLMTHSTALRDLVYWQAWRHVPALHDYDVIIQSGNNPGWYVPRAGTQTIIKYVHSPQRTPYDRWVADPTTPGVFQRSYAEVARQAYAETLSYPDVFVVNSELVARRCQTYWGIPDDRLRVVYPPVDVTSYTPAHTAGDGDGDYYFTFSRLYPSKRIHLLVEAFNHLPDDYRLVVGGSGPERDRLERLAGENVEFTGYVSEREKRQRLAECRAFLFAATNEDFGLCPVEAFASGTPVLGVRDGYTQYQIHDGQNGRLFDPTVPAIRTCVREFDRDGVAWTTREIARFAEQFGTDRFRQEMRAVVDEACERARVTPEHELPSETTPTTVADQLAAADAATDGGHHP